MPRATPPPSRGSYHPPNDPATYRDLLLFEERLKTNAASLQRRKSRYQLFLLQLILVIAFLLAEILLPTSILATPYRLLLQTLLPDIYTPDVPVVIHPYFASGLLFVAVTTLMLFFASGMYSEKIAYANQYVPHANRALRSFNMYLNVRKPPFRSKLPRFLSFFFPRPTPYPEPRPRPAAVPTAALPIPPIPPASNPRGELIFSSRVDRAFRDSYDRYRATFERRRAERAKRESRGWWWPRTKSKEEAPASAPGSRTASLRGGVSGSRRSSPVPGRGTPP